MNSYTVIGYFKNDKIKYVGWHWAKTPADAKKEAEDWGIRVVEVVYGIHTGQSGGQNLGSKCGVAKKDLVKTLINNKGTP